MSFDAPFKLGPFSMDSEGRLSPRNPATPPVFLFRWHDRVVRARLDQAMPREWAAGSAGDTRTREQHGQRT